MSEKKVYIIAGEPSGDLHAGNLMKALLEENDRLDFRFWGGDNMKRVQPSGLVKHIEELAFMGFVEVLMNLRTILKNLQLCKEDILAYQPDALILVDYPGFNLRIAEWAKSNGIPVHYYISPQIWAWKQSRVHKIKRVVDKMYVILPFEKEFYARFDMDVEYVGHPLIDEISAQASANTYVDFLSRNQLSDKPIIALLPGSRKQEVSRMLPLFLEATRNFPDHQIVVAGAPTLSKEFYASIHTDCTLVFGQTYALLSHATAALVTSGTATLETALFKVPEVVCYKGSSLSYIIAKQLVKVDYISLVNLIMGKEVVKELIQHDCTTEIIQRELKKIVENTAHRSAILKEYHELEKLLGGGGASKKVAQSLLKSIP